MFFGYSCEEDMRVDNPNIGDALIKTAKRSKILKCSGPECIGSIDGKEFLYKNKPSDAGVFTEIVTLKVNDNTFSWIS